MGVGKELFVGFGSALATTAGLFALQLWYSSYLDVAVIHGDQSKLPMDAKLQAVRTEEQAKLASGRMPIDQAIQAIAQRGRNAFPNLAARPSDDLSAMSGWVHKPGFKPYAPRAAAPAAPAAPLARGPTAAAQGADDAAPEEQRHAR